MPADSPIAAGLPKGMVHKVAHQALSRHRKLSASDFYVCGPPAMLAATGAMLTRTGVANEGVELDERDGGVSVFKHVRRAPHARLKIGPQRVP